MYALERFSNYKRTLIKRAKLMHNKVSYYFNPAADNAQEHLEKIVDTYKDSLKDNPYVDESALRGYNSLKDTLETMQTFQEKFGYNGIHVHSFNGQFFIGSSSTIENSNPQTVEMPAAETISMQVEQKEEPEVTFSGMIPA